jgi:hypothetical protein
VITQFTPNDYPSTDYRYYRALYFQAPTGTGGSTQCNDEAYIGCFLNQNTTTATFTVTPSTVPNINIYKISIQGSFFANPQLLLNSYGPCDDANTCKSINGDQYQNIAKKVQDFISATTVNITDTGLVGFTPSPMPGKPISPDFYTKNPFQVYYPIFINSPGNPQGSTANTSNFASVYQYQMKTYPSSGASPNSQTVISGLTADTCSSLTGKTYNPYSADSTNYRSTYQKYHFYYDIVDNPNVTLGYSIYANDILSNGQPSGTQTLIATGTGSTLTIINSSYFTP